ncbi:DUF1499 domain-containing protein [Verrucomicrobiales bacterium]|jgi:uncharacterized protein (DUF1499 family)|nr:DUF1499 domain-containing protein [Verrucomicrobiales bacterium]
MDPIFIIVIVAVFLIDFAIFGGLWFLGAWSRANRPETVNDGKIGDVTGKPNCVSSLAEKATYQIDPISYQSDEREVWGELVAAVESLPKTQIITNEPPYLYAESFSKIFGFVDDLELVQDEKEKIFHVRAASRAGYSDNGVNRRRVEMLRKKLS